MPKLNLQSIIQNVIYKEYLTEGTWQTTNKKDQF